MSADAVTPASLRDWPLPPPGESKRERGDVLVVGGARTTPGAAVLAGLAALRVGAGRLTIALGESVAPHVAATVWETGVLALAETAAGAIRGEKAAAAVADAAEGATCVIVGPGLDDLDEAAALVEALADTVPADTPVLLDAYALGVLPRLRRDLFAGRLLLTPNLTEAEVLLGREVGDLADDTARIAEQHGAVVACMHAVAAPDGRRWEITTGARGLATSGSGDVLAGAIGGIRARGADPAQAVCWGAYVHAAAGDRLQARLGPVGFLARELLHELPHLLTELG